MKQTHQLKELTVGEEYITVITYDMALFAKAVQLVDARPDLKGKVLPRLGELHIVMRALRALGSSIENSGIDDAWMETDVYGSATTRQIIKCTHYKRSLRAHIFSYMALYELAIDQFLKDKAAHRKQVPLDPLQNDYHKDHDDGQLNPITTDVPPAPKAIIEMVRYQCKGNCTSNRCSCKLNNLPCTYLSMCNTHCENDEDTYYKNRDSDDDSDD